jgi:aerobic carbon-monoxide dehydrogenase small subunit
VKFAILAREIKMTRLNINKKNYEINLKGHETLLEVLRDHLALTGTKTACEEAECGACTVIINGKAVLACIILACALEGDQILTIEGLSNNGKLDPLQEAFIEKGAVQCGFCIPGMIMSAKALLDQNFHPGHDDIRHAIDGNICRCAGYIKIQDAIEYAGQLKSNSDIKPTEVQ